MDLRRLILNLSFLFWAGCWLGSAVLYAEDATWKEITQQDGIKISTREIADSPLVAVRGEAEIDAPPGKVAHVIMDCSRTHEWVDRLDECRFLKKISELEYVTYNHFGTPFIVKDRDFVAHVLIDVDRPKKTLTLNFKSREDPLAPKTNYVRGDILMSRYTLVATPDGKRTLFTGEAHVDPKGSIPKWLVNHLQRKWPLITIKALQAQLKKPDLVTPDFFQHVLDDAKSAPKP